MATLRRKLGSKRVVYRAGIVSISGTLPVTVLRHAPAVWDPPSSEPELAGWLNDLLGLKARRGVSRNDPRLVRLARWIRNRRTSQPHSRLRDSEIVERAAAWLPQWFQGVSVDPATLRVHWRAAELTVVPIWSDPSAPTNSPMRRRRHSPPAIPGAESALCSG